MSDLPERPSLDYLKKLAKQRLRALPPPARLADAQLAIAREYGQSSWRALKAAVEAAADPQADPRHQFFAACATGDAASARTLLGAQPALARTSDPTAPHAGWTALHTAARSGHLPIVRLLLDGGADPAAVEAGDRTTPLFWAAAHRHLDVARALLDAGADPRAGGDDHDLDVIGWATFFRANGDQPGTDPRVAHLLVERGARHHIFSALAIGDPALVRAVAQQDPRALLRRMSRFEQGLTPLHFALLHRPDLVPLLLELGADVESVDARQQTPLDLATARRDHAAIAQLRAAGARPRKRIRVSRTRLRTLVETVSQCVPMLYVPDVAAALDWYTGVGFRETARYSDDRIVNFGVVALGRTELMLNCGGRSGPQTVSLWFTTPRIDELYELFRSREDITIEEPLNDTFYHARQFAIRDPHGYVLYFIRHSEP
jgi:ankyrin repeat protein/uncharacterized glyoxalase superfamily protein PhnB